MKKTIVFIFLFSFICFIVPAQNLITQWTFENMDNIPSKGSGSLTAFPSTLTQNYVTGYMNKGTALNTTEYNKVYDSVKLTGLSFDVSTLGKTGIKVFWCERHSNTASRFIRLQYSIDGNVFKNFVMNTTNVSITNTGTPSYWKADLINNVIKDTVPGVSGSSGWAFIKADLNGLNGIDNNPLFRFRVCPVAAPGDTVFAPTSSVYNYGTTGTIRFDSITVTYATPVPVRLKDFTFFKVDQSIDITWTSFDEINVGSYVLEMSSDGSTFNDIRSINPQNLSSAIYNISLPAPTILTYYRLKVINKSGEQFFSNTLYISQVIPDGSFRIYPNPAFNSVYILYYPVEAGAYLSLFNSNGQFISDYPLIKGSCQTSIDVHLLNAGNYVLTLSDKGEKKSEILIIK